MAKLEYKFEENRHGYTEVVVLLDSEEVYRWHDNAQIDYPEDLCWSRMISEVFEKGVEIGKRLASTEEASHDD